MNKQSILQYLSSASDTFLLVAFFALIALPIVIAVGVQPIKDAAANAPVLPNQTAYHEQQPSVLGISQSQVVTASPNPISMVKVDMFTSNDIKKYIISDSSSNLPTSTSTITTKIAGSYDVLKLTNPSSQTLNLGVTLSFIDTKSTDTTLIINGMIYNIARKDSGKTLSTISVAPNSDIIISLSSTAKNLGTFKITADFIQ